MPYYQNKDSNIDHIPNRVRTLVVGGGIHGVGVAHDLASRGWTDTLVVEKGSIGMATSSASTKLIHGGLRYLKRFSQFPLVRKSLGERQRLMHLAPDLIRPIELIYPILKNGGMPKFMVRMGLFLYDLLAKDSSFGKHRSLTEQEVHKVAPELNSEKFKGYFSFWDGQTDDLGLVIRVASSAVKLGATISEGIEVLSIEKIKDGWMVEVQDGRGKRKKISCLYLINCAGPWSNLLLKQNNLEVKVQALNNKGAHFITTKLKLKQGFFFESPADKRIFFALPWMNKTLIGTTEDLYSGDPDDNRPSPSEINYLLENANEYFNLNLSKSDIDFSFSGLRWLASEGGYNISKTSREVVVSKHESDRGFMLTIYGGKLTSYRNLSESIGDEVTGHFGAFKRSRTHDKEYWADVHENIKDSPSLEERFRKSL
jgi:glycerol-3-phosphate dehydrogenase